MALEERYFVSDGQQNSITGQMLEILRQLRMDKGSTLDPEKVKETLQEIIDPWWKEGLAVRSLRV